MSTEPSNIETKDLDDKIVPFYRTRLFKWGIAMFFFISIIVFGFVWFTEYVAGNLLVSQVESHTDGAYTVSFDKLRIDWARTKIKVINLKFQRTDLEIDRAKEFAFEAENTSIQLENILGIYYNKALHVVRIKLDSPDFQVTQKRKSLKKTSFSLETGDLYKVLQGFVESFHIDDLEVSNLHFDYHQPFNSERTHFTVNDVSFNIENLHLDSNSVAQIDGFFFTESFSLQIKNQDFELGDGVHSIHFDSLSLSTQSNNIELFNFRLRPIDSIQLRTDSTFNTYNTQVPYTGIIGLNFLEAYQHNVLHIDSILLRDSQLSTNIASLKRTKSTMKVDTTVNNRVLALILHVFDRVELNRFSLTNAKLTAEYGDGDTAKINQLNIDFNQFSIDSNALKSNSYYPDFAGAKVNINNPEFTLPGGNVVNAQALSFSTYDSILILTEAVLNTSQNLNGNDSKISIEEVKLVGVKPKQILKEREINLSKMIVLKPELQIFDNPNLKQNNSFSVAKLLDGKIKQYRINQLQIKNGKANLITQNYKKSPHQIGKFNLELTDFVLNEKSIKRNQFLWSQNAKMHFENVRIFIKNLQHYVTAGAINLNSSNGLVNANRITMYPTVSDSSKLDATVNVKVAQFQTLGLDFKNLLHLHKLDLSKFVLKDADGFINQLRVKSDSLVDSTKTGFGKVIADLDLIHLANVDVSNVNLVIQKHGVSSVKFSKAYVQADDLAAIPDSGKSGNYTFTSDSLQYGVERLMAPILKDQHMLSIQKVNRATDSLMHVVGFSIRPIPGKLISDSVLKVTSYVSKMEIAGFHTLEKILTDSISVGFITLAKPILRVRLPLKDSVNKKPFYLPEAIPEDFLNGKLESFKLAGLDIMDGNISVVKEGETYAVRKLNLHTTDAEIAKNSSWSAERFLYAKDFNVSMEQLEYHIPGFTECHQINSLRYNSQQNILSILGVYFSNVNWEGVKQKQDLSFSLPYVNVVHPDIYQYVTDSNIVIDRIETAHGLIAFNMYKNKVVSSKKPFSFPTEIPSTIKGFKKLSIHQISVDKMDFEMQMHAKDRVTPLELDQFSLQVDSFQVYPGQQVDSNRLLWSKNIELNAENIFTFVDNGLYELGADEFRFSTQKDTIGLRGVSFAPTVNRYEYALHKGHQTDVFNISVQQFGVQDLNYFDLVYGKKINGGLITLNQPSMAVLKDKRIPPAPYKRKEIIPEMFKLLPVKITFDSILVSQMRVLYEEFPEHGRRSGNIMLNLMDIKATNVTNDTDALNQDSTLRIYMSSKLLDTADIQLYLEYNMLSPMNNFKMSTELGEMDGTIINRYIEPTANARIEQLDVDRMEMSVIGNDSVAGGRMGFYYDNLNFRFLNQEAQSNRGLGLKSWVGNFVVKSKNKYHPIKRRAPLYFERNTNKGWINYLIKLELTGLGSSAGLKTKSYKKHLNSKNTKATWRAFDKEYKSTRKALVKAQKKASKAALKKKD